MVSPRLTVRPANQDALRALQASGIHPCWRGCGPRAASPIPTRPSWPGPRCCRRPADPFRARRRRAGRRHPGRPPPAHRGRLRLRWRHRLRGRAARAVGHGRGRGLPGAQPLRDRLRPVACRGRPGRDPSQRQARHHHHRRQRHRQRRRRGHRQCRRHRRGHHRPPPAGRHAARRAGHREPQPARLRLSVEEPGRRGCDLLHDAGAARRAAPARRLRGRRRPQAGRAVRPGGARHRGRRGQAGRQQSPAGHAGPAAHARRPPATGPARPVRRGRPRAAQRQWLRPGLRAGSAHQRRRTPGRHEPGHRLPDHRRRGPGAGDGARAGQHQPRASHHRGRDARTGAGRDGRAQRAAGATVCVFDRAGTRAWSAWWPRA